MQLYTESYYQLYNRSNNDEVVFKSDEIYFYFLKKYRHYFENDFDTIAYCLMPTHFHFLIYIKSENTEAIKKNIGTLLSSYTKAINEQHNRHGSLFQNHTKAKLIDNDAYLLTLLTYIHQNPLRAKLVTNLEDWKFSSYLDYIGKRKGTLPKTDIMKEHFASMEEFKKYSQTIISSVEKKYWV